MAIELPKLGEQGASCPECGSVLATDQRYCLNCGWRRAEPRVDYERQLTQPQVAAAGPGAPTGQMVSPQFTPVIAIGAIAVLGIMLLLGVLIGKDEGETVEVGAAAAPTTTTAAAPTTTTAAAPTTPAKTPKAKAPAAAAPGTGKVEKGGSGSTEGVGTADLDALEEAQREGKGKDAGAALPDQVATQGPQAQQDPNGQAGGGSGSTCIGC
jgi:uncharacterized OB-fold protein